MLKNQNKKLKQNNYKIYKNYNNKKENNSRKEK